MRGGSEVSKGWWGRVAWATAWAAALTPGSSDVTDEVCPSSAGGKNGGQTAVWDEVRGCCNFPATVEVAGSGT